LLKLFNEVQKPCFPNYLQTFFKSPLWLNLSPEYRSIFQAILFNCVYKTTEVDDFGLKTILKPGQCLMTERQIIDEAFPPTKDLKKLSKYKSIIHRSFAKFKKMGFSNHETNQRKTIHTILSVELLKEFEPIIEPNANHKRRKKERKKEEQEENTHIPLFEKEKGGGGGGVFFSPLPYFF
jgi:hypothetical protein